MTKRHWRIKTWIVKVQCTECDYAATKTYVCRAEELSHRTWCIDRCPHCKRSTCTHTVHEQKQP